jgi:hypothetical protein
MPQVHRQGSCYCRSGYFYDEETYIGVWVTGLDEHTRAAEPSCLTRSYCPVRCLLTATIHNFRLSQVIYNIYTFTHFALTFPVILSCKEGIEWGCMDWIDLAQDRDQWRALVKTVTNLRVPWIFGNSWVAAQLAASEEELRAVELLPARVMFFPIIIH